MNIKKILLILSFNVALLFLYLVNGFVIFNKNLEFFRGDLGCDGGVSSEMVYSPLNRYRVKYNMIICGGGPIEYRIKMAKNFFPYEEFEILSFLYRDELYSYAYSPEVRFEWMGDNNLSINISSNNIGDFLYREKYFENKSIIFKGFNGLNSLRINIFFNGQEF